MQQYSSEPRCDLFDPEQIKLFTFEVDPNRLVFGTFLQMLSVPGLEEPVPGDPDDWVYTAFLGDVEASLCSFQGYAGRLYCDFTIPKGFLESAQILKVYVRGCTPPFFVHENVSIFPIVEAPACTRDLDEAACTASGGTYSCVLACTCTCP